MRKLGNQYIQKGLNKKEPKSIAELYTELATYKTFVKEVTIKGRTKNVRVNIKDSQKLSKKELSKQLGISDRTLRSYKKYFASLDNPQIKLNKNDRKPPKKVLDKIKKVSQNYKIKQTRVSGNKFDKNEVENFIPIIDRKTWDRVKGEMLKKNWFGWLIRINIAFITKQGTFNDWLTFVTSYDDYKELNQFLYDQIYKKVTAKNSILGFEIIEVVINVTTTDYEANKPKIKNEKRKK